MNKHERREIKIENAITKNHVTSKKTLHYVATIYTKKASNIGRSRVRSLDGNNQRCFHPPLCIPRSNTSFCGHSELTAHFRVPMYQYDENSCAFTLISG